MIAGDSRFDDLIPRWLFVVTNRGARAIIGLGASLAVGVGLALADRPEDLRLAPLLAVVLVIVAVSGGPEGSIIAGPLISAEYWWFAVPPGHTLHVSGTGAVAVLCMSALVIALVLLSRRIERTVNDVRALDNARREQAVVEATLRRRAERTVTETEAVMELGNALAAAHSVAEVAQTALDSLAIPAKPSSASIATVEDDHLRVVASLGASAEAIRALEQVELSRSAWLGAVLAGEPAYVEDRAEFAQRYPDARVLRLYESGSWLVLPFRAQNTIGLLSMHYVEPRPLRDFSLYFSLLREVLGTSLERARLEEEQRRQHKALEQSFEERDRIARTLSTSLLPPTLPHLAGFEASGWLLPASNDELAGDFYDLFVVREGEWVAVLGDVCGKGAEAAAVTSLARYAIRAAALDNPDPVEVVRVANQALVADPSDLFCTAAIVRSIAGGSEVEVTLAGHHQVRHRYEGDVTRLGVFGAALGLATRPLCALRYAMPRGASVVLFSDGLVESDPDFGEDDLDALLAKSTSATAAELSGELRGVASRLRRVHSDDIAVIVIQRT